MSIKIPDYLLKMPKYLPNDLEGMIFTYPNKFPLISSKYEEAAKKYYADPKGFRDYSNDQLAELKEGLKKLKNEYENETKKDLEYLVKLDQRLNKLFCFKFWIVNYLFADGPIHSFYVDQLKRITRKIVAIDQTEKYEEKVANIIQKLLQADYADLYLTQALNCNTVMNILEKEVLIKDQLEKVQKLIYEDPIKNNNEINKIWYSIWNKINKDNKELNEALSMSLSQVKHRKSMLPLYNALTHTIEFKRENIELQEKFNAINSEIEEIFKSAKKVLNIEEYELFKLSYEQAKNFSMYKDVMGSIDGELLPFWYGIHDKIKVMLKSVNENLVNIGSGQAAMFYLLVWYLPDNLKGIVMTPDFTDFTVESL